MHPVTSMLKFFRQDVQYSEINVTHLCYLGPFHQLRYKVRFRANFISNKNGPLHLADASPDWGYQLHAQQHGISRHNHFFKLAIIDFEEVGIVLPLLH